MKKYDTIISACLLGIPCRYNKKVKINKKALKLFLEGNSILVCPEISAGQKTPRPACEIVNGNGFDVMDGKALVIDKKGNNYTKIFIEGAKIIFNNVVKKHNIRRAILKSGSPSCGVNKIYSGEFNGKKIKGCGVLAAILKINNIDKIEEL
ncbi:MAG: DUF523 domain-containing protein [Patescibacteria group bacterium]|nr:DUF523 domain-containing protein [Patescibacteria group bacterium]